MNHTYVKCNNCGWVHFAVSTEYTIQWEKDWVVHWNNLDQEGRQAYGLEDGPPKKENTYLNCHRCNGSYSNFKDAEYNDIPYGSTIGPILDRNEKET